MPDPVSWFLVERGWKVVAAGGEAVGKVHEVLGDPDRDIFGGLTVSTGLLSKPRYVAAELVTSIYEGEVHVALTPAQIEALEPYAEPPAASS